jgi:hypothetical protein
VIPTARSPVRELDAQPDDHERGDEDGDGEHAAPRRDQVQAEQEPDEHEHRELGLQDAVAQRS